MNNIFTLEMNIIFLLIFVNIFWALYTLKQYSIANKLMKERLKLINLENVLDEVNVYIDSFYSTILTATLFELSITNKKNSKYEEIINDMTLEIYTDFLNISTLDTKLNIVFKDNKEDFTLKYIKSRILIITTITEQGGTN